MAARRTQFKVAGLEFEKKKMVSQAKEWRHPVEAEKGKEADFAR